VPPKQVEKHSENPQLVNEYLPVERKREGTKIALPFADTPVQNRNKQMREKAANKQKSRRSSSGIRGRRASSLLDSGTSNGQLHIHDIETNTRVRQFHAFMTIPLQESEHLICQISLSSNTNAPFGNVQNEFEADEINHAALPHADVDTKDFYKHIDPTLPEPHRMRHLLTWCGARTLPEKVPGGNRDPNETLAVDAGKLMRSNIYFVFDS
jgi:kinetochore protein Mis13/DSN1